MATNVLRRRRIDCFRHGHPGYSDWLAEYPHGYVLTLRGHDVAPILHRADCPHVSSRRQQHPKTDQYEKRCAVRWIAPPRRRTIRCTTESPSPDRLTIISLDEGRPDNRSCTAWVFRGRF